MNDYYDHLSVFVFECKDAHKGILTPHCRLSTHLISALINRYGCWGIYQVVQAVIIFLLILPTGFQLLVGVFIGVILHNFTFQIMNET